MSDKRIEAVGQLVYRSVHFDGYEWEAGELAEEALQAADSADDRKRVPANELEQLRNLVLWSHDPNADYIYDKLSAWLGEQA